MYLGADSQLYTAIAREIDDIFRLGVIPIFTDVPPESQVRGFPHQRSQSATIVESLWKDIRA